MSYQSSVAYQLDATRSTWGAPARGHISVHEGGGLDARVERESAARTSSLARIAVAVTFAFVLLGAARVALTAQTVTLLKQVSTAEATVKAAFDTRTELRVERSTLTNADRIQRIATENYGMVYALDVDTISLEQGDEGAASADAAQEGLLADANGDLS